MKGVWTNKYWVLEKFVHLNQDTFDKRKSSKTTEQPVQYEMFHENGANPEKREGVMMRQTKCIFHVLFIKRQLM